jgi:hypothetical protein
MKLTRVAVLGAGFIAMAVSADIWHRYSGWYDWGAFPSGPFFVQVLSPAILMGAICGLTVRIASKQE